MKRLLDIVLSLVALAILAAPFAFIMIVLRFTGEGKIWFSQKRVGKGGELFNVYKFVTMYEGSELRGNKDITVPGDTRVLPVGRVLRKFKLNELPQFVNVLKGDMSMVGWRPLLPQGFELYPHEIQINLHKIKPGLTGIGSLAFNSEEEIIGEARRGGDDLRLCYRDEIMPYKGDLECWYIANQSLAIDLKILIATLLIMLSRKSTSYRRWFKGLPVPKSKLIRKYAMKQDVAENTEPIKIMYLHQFFATPCSSFGTRSYEFARRFVANGHDVRMITTPAYMPEEYRNKEKKLRTQEFEGIDAVILPIKYANQMSYQARVRAFIKFAFLSSLEALRYKPDVIFATSTPLTIIIPALVAKLRWRKPMVFEVRDLWPEAPIAIGALKNPLMIGIARAMEWVAYHSAIHVVALSDDMKKGVIRRGISEDQISVIPNSSDTQLFDVASEAGLPVREKLGLSDDHKLVVYTGTFGIVNHIVYLVEVAAAMREISSNIRFLFVGSGNRKHEAVQQARELGVLGDNLEIWDPVPKTEIPSILAASSIATSTVQNNKALWPNSANKIFDAMAARKPIAINHGGWQADLIEETGTGVVMDPSDPVKGAKALADFLLDEERLAKGSRAARELAYSRFSRDRLAEELESILMISCGRTIPEKTMPSTPPQELA